MKGLHLMALLLGVVCGKNKSTHERRLIADLLSQRAEALGPNIRNTRPMKTEGPVNLKVTIRFHKLVELDAASDVLTAKLWIYLEWTDFFMTWNPEDYGNTTNTVWLAMDDVWMPDFTIYDSYVITFYNFYLLITNLYLRDESRTENTGEVYATTRCVKPRPSNLCKHCANALPPGTRRGVYSRVAIRLRLKSRTIENHYNGLYIKHDGTVVFVPIVVASIPCYGDISTFPYDIHRCTISLGSWLYTSTKINLTSGADDESFMKFYHPNQQWSLSLDSHGMESILDECFSEDDFETVTYHVVIKRNAPFFFFALIFPGCLLNLIITVMFILPPEFPDKVNIGVSIFLSHIVLIVVFVEVIPSNGQSLPVIGKFYSANTCMAVVSILASVVTYNMQARTSALGESSKKFLIRSAQTLGLRQKPRDPTTEAKFDAFRPTNDFWHLMARVVDRILLLIYMVTMVAFSLTILFQLGR
ncbi:hypothetical protein CAPTEDRAFT_216933 [Capitella teleta]|uniref:Neurotransmitter-gated ion-channel ligand-binding domain-containing protein n=1 Tax=Capitella teleta TaxID=283909 RepID=R7VDQ2_CAPTE|nr:hypothetical protein CAPTEDRAFT_216933 [Capitella teleta]|eukprot:ELU16749.1 hypothetical protein CAPTEDRAFT_216933 [Capitella teleta]